MRLTWLRKSRKFRLIHNKRETTLKDKNPRALATLQELRSCPSFSSCLTFSLSLSISFSYFIFQFFFPFRCVAFLSRQFVEVPGSVESQFEAVLFFQEARPWLCRNRKTTKKRKKEKKLFLRYTARLLCVFNSCHARHDAAVFCSLLFHLLTLDRDSASPTKQRLLFFLQGIRALTRQAARDATLNVSRPCLAIYKQSEELASCRLIDFPYRL